MAKTTKQDEVRPIIVVKKVKKVAGGHHGGAWKVAYADFVTAMMAFFLMLWLLNVIKTDELKQIANYFDPANPKISQQMSGAGGLMGGTTVSPTGAMTSTVQPLTEPQPTGMVAQTKEQTKQVEQNENVAKRLEEELKQKEEESFKKAQDELKKAIAQNPALAALSKNLVIDETPEGLRIQLVDQDGKPMFPLGSAEMFGYTRDLLGVVAKVINTMPNDVSVRGHTDSVQYGSNAKYTNWELSSDRANASRRELAADGVPEKRLANVMGKADREPFDAKNPNAPQNRRISIILLRESVEHAAARGAFGEAFKPTDAPADATPAPAPLPYQKTQGSVYFP